VSWSQLILIQETISSQFNVKWYHTGSWKWPWYTTENSKCLFIPFREAVVKHLPTPYYIHPLFILQDENLSLGMSDPVWLFLLQRSSKLRINFKWIKAKERNQIQMSPTCFTLSPPQTGFIVKDASETHDPLGIVLIAVGGFGVSKVRLMGYSD
jgi:hypothetical protein